MSVPILQTSKLRLREECSEAEVGGLSSSRFQSQPESCEIFLYITDEKRGGTENQLSTAQLFFPVPSRTVAIFGYPCTAHLIQIKLN